MYNPLSPPACTDAKDPAGAAESQACCNAMADAMKKTTCPGAEGAKASLDTLLKTLELGYAQMKSSVCASNQACNYGFSHDQDFKTFVGGQAKDKSKVWMITTFSLAGILLLVILYNLMT